MVKVAPRAVGSSWSSPGRRPARLADNRAAAKNRTGPFTVSSARGDSYDLE